MGVAGRIRRELRELWADGRGPSLVAIAAGWGLLNGSRMIYPALLPAFADDFGFTLTSAGLLVTVIWLCYAVGQVPGGVLADRYGERRVLVTSVVIAVTGLVASILAPTAVALVLGAGLFGLGVSQYPIARITALSDLYPDRIGRALGLTMASGDVGQTLLPPIASALAAAVAWQLGLGIVVPALCLAIAGLWLTLPAAEPAESAVDRLSAGTIRHVLDELREARVAILVVILVLFMFVWQTFSAFYPTYLVDVKGHSPVVAGVLFGLFFAVGVVAKPLSGVAYDRLGLRRTLPLVLAGSIVGFLALPYVSGFWPLAGVTVLASTMLGSGAITQSYLAEVIPAEIQGTGLGLVRSTAAMLGATGPVLFGAVADRGFFDEGYVALAVLVAIVSLLALRTPGR